MPVLRYCIGPDRPRKEATQFEGSVDDMRTGFVKRWFKKNVIKSRPIIQQIEHADCCARNQYLKSGVKLHFGNSNVDLDNPEHVAKLRQVFRAADTHNMAIVVHMHANVNHHRPYGKREAEIFLTKVLPAAPHSIVQIAHLAGSGGYDDPATDEALGVFIRAISRRDSRI